MSPHTKPSTPQIDKQAALAVCPLIQPGNIIFAYPFLGDALDQIEEDRHTKPPEPNDPFHLYAFDASSIQKTQDAQSLSNKLKEITKEHQEKFPTTRSQSR